MLKPKVGDKVEITGGTYGDKGMVGKVKEVTCWGVNVEVKEGKVKKVYPKYLQNLKKIRKEK